MKTLKPTPEEIKAEIKWLRANTDKIPRTTAFGDNNHDAIEAQIEVLERNLTEEQIWDRSHAEDETEDRAEDDSLWSESVRQEACDARRWLDGEMKEAPSDGWKELVEDKEEDARDRAERKEVADALSKMKVELLVGDVWEVRVPGKRRKVKEVGRISFIGSRDGSGRKLYVDWRRQNKGRYTGMSVERLIQFGKRLSTAAERKAKQEARWRKLGI